MEQLSYWERKAYFENVDVTIIGGGLVGLSCGISLLENQPDLHVLILERHSIPHGASTKNAGFACFGSPGELLDDMSKRPATEVFELFSKRYRGVQKLMQRTSKSNPIQKPEGGYELIRENSNGVPMDPQILDDLNSEIENVTGLKNYFYVQNERLQEFSLTGFEAIICNDHETCLDPVQTLNCLNELFRSLGGQILYGMPIHKWCEINKGVQIELANGQTFQSRQLLFCVNGFARHYFSELDVQAARNSVLLLRPSKPLSLKGCFHVDKGYLYFRKIDEHLLIGGGRHWDYDNEFTTDFNINPYIEKRLLDFAEEHIFQNRAYTYVQNWTGIMGLGAAKHPIIKMVGTHIGVAVRMGGMGVALASLVGEDAASMLINHSNNND